MEEHKTDVNYEQLKITVHNTVMVLLLSQSPVAHYVSAHSDIEHQETCFCGMNLFIKSQY